MRLPFGSRHSVRDRLTSPASLAVGAGVVAAAGGVLWRAFNGGGSGNAPDQIAALTAQAVADASRESVIEAVEQATEQLPDEASEPREVTIANASTEAVREPASAGAHVTAAALGAAEGAAVAARAAGLSRGEALEAARRGALAGARDIGAPAAERVERVLRALAGVAVATAGRRRPRGRAPGGD